MSISFLLLELLLLLAIVVVSGSNDAASIRKSIMDLVAKNPSGTDSNVRADFARLLKKYALAQEDRDPDDVVFQMGTLIYDVDLSVPPFSGRVETDDDDRVLSADPNFVRRFFQDVFASYGMPEPRARLCATVLLESGVTKLESVQSNFCERMDEGTLLPSPPMVIVKDEGGATVVVDGHMGVGLYVAPYCMQLAINRAKAHGVGFVVVQRSSDFGSSDYYAKMAASQGCVGWAGSTLEGESPSSFGIPTDQLDHFAIPSQVFPESDESDATRSQASPTKAIVDVLSTSFQSGPFGDDLAAIDPQTGKPKSAPVGHFFLAIDVSAVCELDEFKSNAGKMLRHMKDNLPLAPKSNPKSIDVTPTLRRVMRELRRSRPGLDKLYSTFPWER